MFGWHHHRERRIRKGQRGTELEREREGGGGGERKGEREGGGGERQQVEIQRRRGARGGGLENADAADVGNKFLVVRVCGC